MGSEGGTAQSPQGRALEARSGALRVDDLSVKYGTDQGLVWALDQVTFEIARGEVLGLVGESGSGKSTVVLALLGLLGKSADVEAKALEFDGHDLLRDPVTLRGRRIGVVFQDPSSVLNPALPIGLQVAEPLLVHQHMARAEAFRRALDLLEKMGIPRPQSVMHAYPHQLSGGMKQRAVIAAALATEPDLLLLDEPTTALDVTVEAQILDLLDSLRVERGLTMLLVSHNLGIVDRVCDRVCVLYAGRTLEFGPTVELLRSPKHPYTRGLLGSLPHADRPQLGRLIPIPGNLPDLTSRETGCNFRPRCPFAQPSCALPQRLLKDTQSHLVRCHRFKEISDLPWPTTTPAVEHAGLTSGLGAGSLLEATGMRRSFGRHSMLLRWLGKERTVQAVDGVSLNVQLGETVGLVGESGCGKSTLGRLLLRLISAESGSLSFSGRAVPNVPGLEFRRRAQIVFQNPDTSLNPRQTVATILKRPLRLSALKGQATGQEIDRLLDLVRLPPSYRGRYPHQLSGGEKQRVGIARALATHPDFMVADEAVSALDVSVQAAILNLLIDLREQLGVAYLFISHDIGVVAHIATRIAVMYRGRIVEEGTTAQVLHPPYHPYTEALLSSVPIVGARGRSLSRIRLRGDANSGTVGMGCPFAPRCHRRIGPICDTVPPPWRVTADGHRIACHIPLPELAAVPPALGV